MLVQWHESALLQPPDRVSGRIHVQDSMGLPGAGRAIRKTGMRQARLHSTSSLTQLDLLPCIDMSEGNTLCLATNNAIK
jgi:hypothetical protein